MPKRRDEGFEKAPVIDPSKFVVAVSGGWPKVISNLKSLLETGSAVLQDPYPGESAHAGRA
jgi:hypothetical protein